jgi:CHAT domain-containing protein
MHKYIIHIIIILFFISPLQAQKELHCPHPDTSLALDAYKRAKFIMGTAPQKMDSAVYYMTEAKKIFQKLECWEQVVRMSYNLSVMHTLMRNADEMKREMFFAEKTSLRHLPDTSFWHAKVLSFMGQYYMRKMALDSAKMYLVQSKYIFKHQKSWKDFVSSCRILAQVSMYQQNYSLMERYIDQAFEVTKEHMDGDKKMLKSILQLYGVLYYRTGDYEAALERTKEGLEIALKSMKTRNDSTQVASYYNNIGLFYIEVGDVDKAEDYCKSALSLSISLDEWYKAGTIYLNLAEFFVKKDQTHKAYEYFGKAFETLKKVKKNDVPQSDYSRSQIQNNIGLARTAYDLNKKEEALAALDRNLLLHRKEPYKEEMTLLNYGAFYLKEKEYKKSISYLNKAKKVAEALYTDSKHPDLADIYLEIAEWNFVQGKLDESLTYADKASEALTMRFSGEINDDLSVVSDKHVLIDIFKKKTQIYIKQDRIAEAYENSLNAANLTDELRNAFKSEGSKLFILQKVIPIYEQTIKLAYQLYQKDPKSEYIDKAFELVEKSKAMLLLDAMRAEDARAFGGVPDKLLREERRLARELAKKQKRILEIEKGNQKEIDKIQQEILDIKRATLQLQDTLEENYYRYFKLKYEDKTPLIGDVQDHLDKTTLLVEFFVGEEHVYWFAIDKKQKKFYQIPKNGMLEEQINALRLALTSNRWLTKDDKLKEIEQLLTENGYLIYEELLKDCLNSKHEVLMVIPDGALNYIPFEVLMTEKVEPTGATPNFKNLPYLLKDYAVFYHYSAALLLYERKKNKSNGKIIAFAPTFQYNSNSSDERQHSIRSSVDELPGAKREVDILRQRFKGQFYYNDDANEAVFKEMMGKNNFGVVHLAMHGWVDASKPEYSNLVFSYVEDNGEDNLLFAYELNFLNLDAELVVLSACETGFGKYERGEGVVSIGRGFMYAGVPSLVMTLWPINDQASAMLITEFYNQLAEGKPKHIAMQQAKLNYLNNANALSSHPFFWASYINLGDESPIRLKKQGDWTSWLLWGGLSILFIAVAGLFAGRIRKSIQIKKSEDRYLS